MANVNVALPGRAYDIIIESDVYTSGNEPNLNAIVADRRCLIISDTNVAPLYADAVAAALETAGAMDVDLAVFEAGETSKNLDTVQALYSGCVKAGLSRKSLVVALGGGVPGDTAGFVAATWMRGIDLIQFPTSLLAQVDSSVGGKTGVDTPAGKNLVGAFLQPKLVVIDVNALRTLDPRQLRCGLAEVVKYGVILDADFFDKLEENVECLNDPSEPIFRDIVARSCELKAQIVIEDEFEGGVRAFLNYGHTFGHAIEKLQAYDGYTHGEAIAIGMGMAADLAHALEPTEARADLIKRQDALFQAIGLPTRCEGLEPADVLDAMATDKKFDQGSTRLILPDRIGAVRVIADVEPQAILAAIRGRCD